MSNLSAPTVCQPVAIWEGWSGPAAEAVTLGKFVRLNTTSGKIEYGNNTSVAECRNGGIALNSASAGETVDVMARGLVSLGNIFSAMSYDADVYVGTTDGLLATGASGSSSTAIGRVWSAWGHTTSDKLFRVEM